MSLKTLLSSMIERINKSIKLDDSISAEVGQTIAVKAVDENSKPIEWEMIKPSNEFPDTPQFDFIVEEECVSILLDTLNDIPLSDYNFSTMYLIINSVAMDAAVSGVLQVRNNYNLGVIRHPIASVNNFIRQTISRWWSVYFNHKEKINFWQTNATARDIDASTRTGQTYSYDNVQASVTLPLTNIYINATEDCSIPVGTRIIVWLK